MKGKKLYSLLPAEFILPDSVDFDRKVIGRSAENIPFIYWPDNVPCIEANAWMLSLIKQGLSTRNRGGTLAEYAKNISPLIRFCHQNDLNFTQLSDNYFRLFIKRLMARNTLGEQVRTSNEVLKIGRKCISFLFFVAYFHSIKSMIGEKNCNITVIEKEFRISQGKGKKPILQFCWHHDSFPSADPVRRRHPISRDVVNALKVQATKVEDRKLRERKELMLACLEQTGGRRAEVANLRVSDIEKAVRDGGSGPLLRMLTLKKKQSKPEYREVPVPRAFIQQAAKYLDTRRRIVREAMRMAKNRGQIFINHDYLFVSHTTGKPLSIDTITTEVHKLCVDAGVKDKPGHPHLFRHAYITEKLKAIICQYDIANKDDFRKALFDVDAFKLELQQWTGHSNIRSLEGYIDLAFNELSHMEKVYNAIRLGSAVSVTLDRISSLQSSIADGAPAPIVLGELEELVLALREDINQAITD